MTLELRVVARILGLFTLVLGALIGLMAVFAGYERWTGVTSDGAALFALLTTAIGVAILGALLLLVGRRSAQLLGQREALLLVGVSWIFGAAIAALPYYVWATQRADVVSAAHDFDSYASCYFESMSGLTTTGATIVQAIGTLPNSLLLWRALTHWLGGLGIVVLFVAVLPMLGVGSRRVYRIEAPGPSPEGVKPRIQDTARVLWFIYSGITVAEIFALRICGMTWFESVCHTFATLATGGFSTQDASIAAFSSPTIHIVIVIFMLMAGVNFALYHQVIQGQWRSAWKDPELRVYLGIILVATIIVTWSLLHTGPRGTFGATAGATTGETVQHAVFQVVAVQTTTGFVSADFNKWGLAAKSTLLILMFIGGSAGSTGGGIKVARIMIAAKVLISSIETAYRKNVVRPVKIGKTVIDPELKLATLVYVVGIGVLFVIGTIVLMFLEADQGIDITTAATASAATLHNIGPGLARVGATENYAWFSDSGKIVLSVLMLLGRLEMFTVIALLSPRFWVEE